MVTQRHNKEYNSCISIIGRKSNSLQSLHTPLGKGHFHTKKSTILLSNTFNWALKKFLAHEKELKRLQNKGPRN